MRPRLAVLLFIAVASGSVAGVLGNATAGKVERKAAKAVQPLSSLVPCPIPRQFRSTFVRAARETHLPLAMLVAVAEVESQFDPRARSKAGAEGLFQVQPATARDLKLNARDPQSNVHAGARYLRLMLDRFSSTELALAAYNAGPSAVLQANGIPSAETRAYVEEVTRIWRAYNGCT